MKCLCHSLAWPDISLACAHDEESPLLTSYGRDYNVGRPTRGKGEAAAIRSLILSVCRRESPGPLNWPWKAALSRRSCNLGCIGREEIGRVSRMEESRKGGQRWTRGSGTNSSRTGPQHLHSSAGASLVQVREVLHGTVCILSWCHGLWPFGRATQLELAFCSCFVNKHPFLACLVCFGTTRNIPVRPLRWQPV